MSGIVDCDQNGSARLVLLGAKFVHIIVQLNDSDSDGGNVTDSSKGSVSMAPDVTNNRFVITVSMRQRGESQLRIYNSTVSANSGQSAMAFRVQYR